jgi:hypothetical protein
MSKTTSNTIEEKLLRLIPHVSPDMPAQHNDQIRLIYCMSRVFTREQSRYRENNHKAHKSEIKSSTQAYFET